MSHYISGVLIKKAVFLIAEIHFTDFHMKQDYQFNSLNQEDY